MSEAATADTDRPLWRRIADYPLVAMLISVTLYMATLVVAGAISGLDPIAALGFQMEFAVVGAVLLILLYKLVIRHLGEQPRDGLPVAGVGRPLAIGLGAGLALFTLIVAVAAAAGVYRLRGEGDASDLLPQLLLSAIFPAVSEEMLFRGILFRWMEEFGGSWVALITSAVLFGAAHADNPASGLIPVTFIAIEAGLMLGAAYMLTRSLWLPMGIHAAWNFTQGEIFDIPVSGTPVHGLLIARLNGPPLLTGNGFGLEASLIALTVATLFGLWLLWLAVRRGELIQPRWIRRRRLAAAP